MPCHFICTQSNTACAWMDGTTLFTNSYSISCWHCRTAKLFFVCCRSSAIRPSFLHSVNLIGLINDRALFKCKRGASIAWLLIDEWILYSTCSQKSCIYGGDSSIAKSSIHDLTQARTAAHSSAIYSANSQLEGNKCVVIEIRTDYPLLTHYSVWLLFLFSRHPSKYRELQDCNEIKLYQDRLYIESAIFYFDLASCLQNVSVINCC